MTDGKSAGTKPRQTGPLKREVIGPPDCPIMVRRTLLGPRSRPGQPARPWSLKLLLHHFLPNADDRDVHDHPRPFVTLVLWGHYDDLRPCPDCRDSCGWVFTGTGGFGNGYQPCPTCRRSGLVLGERMRPGMVRRRRAGHRHRTHVGPRGCWTLVLMGPLRREWGFWKDGKWWPWKLYEEHFGFGMRCDTDDEPPATLADVVQIARAHGLSVRSGNGRP